MLYGLRYLSGRRCQPGRLGTLRQRAWVSGFVLSWPSLVPRLGKCPLSHSSLPLSHPHTHYILCRNEPTRTTSSPLPPHLIRSYLLTVSSCTFAICPYRQFRSLLNSPSPLRQLWHTLHQQSSLDSAATSLRPAKQSQRASPLESLRPQSEAIDLGLQKPCWTNDTQHFSSFEFTKHTMASYYHYNAQVAHAAPVSHNHGGHRSRRGAPRMSVSQNAQRQFRGARSMKDLNESAALSAFRMRFEAGRSFELEDDLEFCPNLLTESDVSSDTSSRSSSRTASPSSAMHTIQGLSQCLTCSFFHVQLVSISSVSERSSLASNSPESSPTQRPQTVASGFSLNSTSAAFIPPSFQSHHASLKLHQPAATRGRNAIPIINPATGTSMSSPPPSVSPAAIQHALGRRW